MGVIYETKGSTSDTYECQVCSAVREGKKYYILCKRHGYRKDYAMLFWGPKGCNYYYDLNKAGLYTKEEIDKILEYAHPSANKAVLQDIVEPLAVASVIDNRCLGRIVRNTQENRVKVGTKMNELNAGRTSWDDRAFSAVEVFKKKNEHTARILEALS